MRSEAWRGGRVWKWSGQGLVGGAFLHHTSHSTSLVVRAASLGGRPELAFGKRRTSPTSSSPPQRAENQPSGDGLPSMCFHLCISLLVPSPPLLSHAVQQGQSAFCQGLEAYQKCIRRNTASGKWSGTPTRKDLLCSFLPAGLE